MRSSDNVTLISSAEALANFRQGLSGKHALDLLTQAEGRLLVQLPVGVGKTDWMVRIILEALTPTPNHDLVLVLVPRRDILQELVERLPADLPRTILHPRPRQRCGDLDAAWTEHERTGCSRLAKEELCQACLHRPVCSWPDQYANLRGVRLILGTQQHLAIDPGFLRRITHLTHARNPLVLLDESDFLVRSLERTVRATDLNQFIAAQALALETMIKPKPAVSRWLTATQLIGEATTADLRQFKWCFPFVSPDWAVEVQRAGRHRFGAAFHFPAFDLRCFVHSDVLSRERLANGDLRFATPMHLGDQFIIFSGSVSKELVRYRLDPIHAQRDLSAPFENHRFEHPETRWYNVNSLEGTANFFPANADRILDFFAQKILANVRAGKRTLLIARKKFLPGCRSRLQQRLTALGGEGIQIVSDHWDAHDLENPCVLPLINYGVSGLNRFQHCEAAYCLTGYYINDKTLTGAFQDLDPTVYRFPVTLDFVGRPRERRVRIHFPEDRPSFLPVIARDTLVQKEADVVVQAVGRVRPFTRGREIITFQAGSLPGVRYTQEFSSPSEIRQFFSVLTPKQGQIASDAARAARLKAAGNSLRQIAAELDRDVSTVKRYLGR